MGERITREHAAQHPYAAEQPQFEPGSLAETFSYMNFLAKLTNRLLTSNNIPNDTQRDYILAGIESTALIIVRRTDHARSVTSYAKAIQGVNERLGNTLMHSLETAQKSLIDME